MSYTRYYANWADLPATSTAITAASLQHIESGILGASNWYNWADIGIKPDGGTTDNAPIINNFFKSLWNSGSGQGGVIVLPQCGFMAGGNTAVEVYSPIILPPYCGLVGMGKQKTMIRLGASCNCDVIQTMQYNSSSQATALSVTATTLQNCFYGLISGLTVHGTWNFQGQTDYHSGINITTNPATSAAGSDPDFDPFLLISDVEVRYASGDGLSHTGRGGLQVQGCLFRYNQGNGVTPSFDSLYTNCDFGFNGVCGMYLNHGSTNGAGCKSYNNGNIPLWVSGTSYSSAAGTNSRVLYNGVIYGCILSTSGTTNPASDTTHWTAISAYTSPAAYGWDFYFDSNAYEACWAGCDSQEPTVGSYYLKGATGCDIQGVSNRPNWDNPATGAQLSSNPNSYGTCAAAVLDAANGCNVSVGYNGFNSAAYVLRSVNSSARCNVIAAGDNTQQAITDASSSLAGNFALVNGVIQSPLTAAQSAVAGVAAVTFATTITLNAQLADHFRFTLTGNTTLAAPTNPADGQKITIEAIQDATGGRTITWNAAFDFGTPGAPALSAASKRDLIGFVYSGSSSKWLFAGVTAGL